MKVLIAEDDSVSRRVLELSLTRWGYPYVSVTDGLEALRLLTTDPEIRIAVLDWMMPGLDGPSVCARVRARPAPQPYVILVTAKAQKEDVVAGLDAGADDYVTKPFESRELRSRIKAGERLLIVQDELQRKVAELERALAEVTRLRGVLPICMYCRRVRDDRDAWKGLEDYVAEHSSVKFSHGMCQACLEKHFPEGP